MARLPFPPIEYDPSLGIPYPGLDMIVAKPNEQITRKFLGSGIYRLYAYAKGEPFLSPKEQLLYTEDWPEETIVQEYADSLRSQGWSVRRLRVHDPRVGNGESYLHGIWVKWPSKKGTRIKTKTLRKRDNKTHPPNTMRRLRY